MQYDEEVAHLGMNWSAFLAHGQQLENRQTSMATTPKTVGRCSDTESIGRFYLKGAGTERELYEHFLRNEEAALVREMREYFVPAKEEPRRLDRMRRWSKIETKVDLWIATICADGQWRKGRSRRAREAILERLRDQWARIIKESLGVKQPAEATLQEQQPAPSGCILR